jgi:CDP-diacylglycerol--glycerol-3-phosphate 3-phosphatidyltransferase
MRWNWPNLLTFFRILIIPVLVLIFYLPFPWAHPLAALLFGLACITDWLDGYLARVLAQTSKLGAFLDPVADKLIVAVALVLLVGEKDLALITIPAAIIIGREIVVSALREWMAELGKRSSVAVSLMGKLKTTVQMVSLVVLLWYTPGASAAWIGLLGHLLIYVAAALTLWSMLIYLRAALPALRD